MRKAIALAAAVAAGALGVASAQAAGTVNVQLKEFKVIPSVTSSKAGSFTFAVRNTGKIDHELVVVRTSLAPGKLPVRNAQASEKGKVGELAALKPGRSGKLTLRLARGKYVLLCNLPAHYQAGQYVGFTVR